jgi:hypothetical protein
MKPVQLLGLPLVALLTAGTAEAQPTTVSYGMSLAGLPIGSATMVLTPNGGTTAVAIAGKVGGPFELGRMNASAVVGQGQVTAQSQSGAGKDASSATLASRGSPGNSAFSYTGQTSRGPGRIAMTVAGGRATEVDAQIPDNPAAVRVPVAEAHKSGIVDPLSLIGQVIHPGGMIKPDGICGKNHGVFTGQARFNLAGQAVEPAKVSGLPEGWSAVSCRVTFAPVSGHRIDKGGDAGRSRTASLVFARSSDGARTVLWSLSVPGTFGAFALTASGIR